MPSMKRNKQGQVVPHTEADRERFYGTRCPRYWVINLRRIK